MTLEEKIKLLKLFSKRGKPFELCVDGVSMEPVLHDEDIITVCRQDKYVPGDIIIFIYKNKDTLVHRLLKIKKGRYFCKGDNSFRLEDISAENIIGAVQLPYDRNNTAEFISASLRINKLFHKLRYDIDAVKLTPEYIKYARAYLGE